MADLAIVAAEFRADPAETLDFRLSAEAGQAGDLLYIDANRQFRLATASATQLEAEVVGMAVNSFGAGQPVTTIVSGLPTVGASAGVQVGAVYVLSTTPGKAMPVADLVTGNIVTVLGVGGTSDRFRLGINASGEVFA